MSEYTHEDMIRDIEARRAARQANCPHWQGFQPYDNLPPDVAACAACGLTKPISETPWRPRT